MYYAKLLLVIALLSICSFTLTHQPDLSHQPIVHLLLNGEPVDVKNPLSLKTQGNFDILVLDEDRSSMSYSFQVILVRENKQVITPVKLEDRAALRNLPLKSILHYAQSGDWIIVEITGTQGSVYYKLNIA